MLEGCETNRQLFAPQGSVIFICLSLSSYPILHFHVTGSRNAGRKDFGLARSQRRTLLSSTRGCWARELPSGSATRWRYSRHKWAQYSSALKRSHCYGCDWRKFIIQPGKWRDDEVEGQKQARRPADCPTLKLYLLALRISVPRNTR